MYFQVTGDVEINKRILNLIRALPGEIKEALIAEATIVKDDAHAHTPWKTGLLKTTYRLLPYETNGHISSVGVGVGSEEAYYAYYVHEDLDANHPNGGEAKFLENAIKRSEPGRVTRVRKYITLDIR
jgi:hypothetical protein